MKLHAISRKNFSHLRTIHLIPDVAPLSGALAPEQLWEVASANFFTAERNDDRKSALLLGKGA
jgi:hypothetical protein